MTMVRANGLAIHVEQMVPDGPAPTSAWLADSGAPVEPPTVVMIHGMANDSLASWYFTLATPLAQAGMRVVMYDQRGHGHSERPPTGYQLDDFVDDLEALLTELGITGPVHLLGNSFGGTVAFGYAMRHPERVLSIGAIESEPATEEWARRVARKLNKAAAYLPREDAIAKIGAKRGKRAVRRARAAAEMIAATSVARDLPVSRIAATEQVTAIDCPVLCIYGECSDMVELAPVIQRLLPRVRTVILPGQRHSLLIDEPATVLRLVLSWLRQECAFEPRTPAHADDQLVGPRLPPTA